jgi:catechol 2,3-dioxygenase-like lactoylglutathione lyase family enzyme
MITKLNVAAIYVLDKDQALDFYVNKLGRGVTDFTQEPTEHFYGIDMGLRDPFGNAIRIVQQGKVAQEP